MVYPLERQRHNKTPSKWVKGIKQSIISAWNTNEPKKMKNINQENTKVLVWKAMKVFIPLITERVKLEEPVSVLAFNKWNIHFVINSYKKIPHYWQCPLIIFSSWARTIITTFISWYNKLVKNQSLHWIKSSLQSRLNNPKSQ